MRGNRAAGSFPGELGAIWSVKPGNQAVSSRRCRRARRGLKLAEAVVIKKDAAAQIASPQDIS